MAGPRKRHQPSSIDRLDPKIQDEIARLRRCNVTIDEILAHLKDLGVDDVSRSALGRHVKSLAEIGEDIRRSETMAKFVVDRFGEETDERVGRANMRILQGAVLELLASRREDDDGNPVSLTAGEAKELALTLQRLIAAQRMDADRQLKLRAEARTQAVKDAAEAVKQASGEKGLSSETADFIMRKVLGVAA
jgi:hypothetical protein